MKINDIPFVTIESMSRQSFHFIRSLQIIKLLKIIPQYNNTTVYHKAMDFITKQKQDYRNSFYFYSMFFRNV